VYQKTDVRMHQFRYHQWMDSGEVNSHEIISVTSWTSKDLSRKHTCISRHFVYKTPPWITNWRISRQFSGL